MGDSGDSEDGLWDTRFCGKTFTDRTEVAPRMQPVRSLGGAEETQWTSLEQLLAEADAEESYTEVESTPGFEAKHGDLTRGELAQIVGLKNKVELNGAVGKLLRFETQAARWHFQLISGLEVIKVRPENLIAEEVPDEKCPAAQMGEESVRDLLLSAER